MNVYKLTIEETIEYEYSATTIGYYLTKDEVTAAIAEYKKSHTKDGKWVPNISSVNFDEKKISFDDAKSEMTIEQFEDLFDTYVVDPRL